MFEIVAILNNIAVEIDRSLRLEILYSIILFLIIFPISLLLRRKSPYWQYGLWILFMIRLILPPNFSSPLSLRSVLDQFGFFAKTSGIQKYINFDIAESENEETISFISNSPYENIENKLGLPIMLLLLSGICIFSIHYLKRILFIRCIIAKSQPVSDGNIINVTRYWCKKLGVRRRIIVVSSNEFNSPFTIGTFKPIIFLPKSLTSTSSSETIEAVIAHEMGHIKRFDDIQIKLSNFIQIVYFFHPLVWLAASQLKNARERICDQIILNENIIAPRQYAAALLKVLLLNKHTNYYTSHFADLSNSKKELDLRLCEILGGKKMRRHIRYFVLATLFIFSMVVLPMSEWNSTYAYRSPKDNALNNHRRNTKDKISFESPMKKGKVSSRFGMRWHPIYEKEMHHNGIDISADIGTKIYASADGVVNEARVDGKYGKKIVINHDTGFQTLYAQLGKIFVKENQEVKVGDLISEVGKSEFSTGPHLHFEVRLKGKPQDPENYIDFSALE